MLVGISCVRNEADIISTTIRHHFNEGFDYLFVVDDDSSDGTARVLERLAAADKRLRFSRHHSNAFRQSDIVTGLAREAVRQGATWIVAFDADEFWHAPGGLTSALRSVTADMVEVQVINFAQCRDQIQLAPGAVLRAVYRPTAAVGTRIEAEVLVQQGICSYLEAAYPPKYIARAAPEIVIGAGSHSVLGPGPVQLESTCIRCLHVPLRAREILKYKIQQSERLDAAELPPSHGWQVRRFAQLATSGDLDLEWNANSQAEGHLDAYRGQIKLIYDPILPRLLFAAAGNAEESLYPHAAYGRTVAVASPTSLSDELDATVRQQAGELEQLRAELKSAAQLKESYSGALQTARATVDNLEEQLSKSRQDQERAAADAERLLGTLQTKADDLERAREANEQLQQQLNRAKSLTESQARALRDGEEALKEHNAQFSLLALKQRLLSELAAETRTVMPLGLTFAHGQLRPNFRSVAVPRSKRRSEWEAVAQSGLFDPEWYLARNPDVANAGAPAFDHFMNYGIAECRDPHPLFSSGWYSIQMLRHPSSLDLPPLLHYLSIGRAKHLSPHPLFDPQYYLASYKDIADSGVDPLQHFLMHGAREWRNPHPLIWMQRLAEQPELPAGSPNVLIAYLAEPQSFAASPHPLFDGHDYLAKNPDVAQAGVNPLLHYCTVGWRRAYAPHRVFAGDWYLARNPDVLAADVNPLEHYVRHGAHEYRDPHPLFDIKFYYARYPESRELPYDALSDYVMNGLGNQRRETTSKISTAEIRSLVPPDVLERAAPISAFLDFDFTITTTAFSRGEFKTEATAAWRAKPPSTYWLPQRLRDYILDRYGDEAIGLYTNLMAIVARHGRQQSGFPQSRDFAVLCDRLRVLAAKRQAVGDPDVSIIVPVFNNFVYTLTSLLSLLEQSSKRSYEVLIGDDGSTDATAEIFAAAGGCVRLVRHEQNLGFLGNCNRTASFARGRTIAFLNNDTQVLPGWLDALIDVLEDTPNAGLAGSKLLNPDGTLQEAGGILWRDGSAWNFGRNDDPALPAYNYVKDVDYVSGASLALPTVLWRRLGGFDAEFAPAYCEDSDLALRIRQAGLRTLYAPHSVVIHHEGKSHGADTGRGVKAYQVENQKKLFARWKHVLDENQPNARNVFVARDRSARKPHILFVDHYVPQWDSDAGSRTIFHFLRMFVAAGFQVSFWPDNLFEDRAYCAPLQRMGVEVIYGRSHVGGFEKFIAEAGLFLDYALLSRPQVALKCYEAIRAHSKAHVLYYGHDIHWVRMEREYAISAAASLDAAQNIEAMRRQEMENWQKADVVLYPSLEERDLVRSMLQNGKAERVPMLGYLPEELAVANENLACFDQRNADELLFVGGSHAPNVDGLIWFAREVMPLVCAQNPRTRLNIVGASTAFAVQQLASESIRILGRVSDEELASLYASMGVAVVPLRYGAGVKGKTLEAFVNAIPLVTTSVGLQGVSGDRPLAFVADDVRRLAEAVLRAQTDTITAKAHVEAAARYMKQAYSIQTLRNTFAAFVREIALARGDASVVPRAQSA